MIEAGRNPMKYFQKTIHIISFCVLVLLVYETSAHAYLDPGSGSYIFQLIIAGFLGIAFTVKMFWRRISAFLAGVFKKNKS